MPTVSQVAKTANIAENTVRNYVKAYPDLFSVDARGLQANRIFNQDDIEVICSLVALKNSGLTLAEAAEQIRSTEAPSVIDVAATPVQEASSALQVRAVDALILHDTFKTLQREHAALQRRHEKHLHDRLWTHGVAFWLGMVTMGVMFYLVWWLVYRG